MAPAAKRKPKRVTAPSKDTSDDFEGHDDVAAIARPRKRAKANIANVNEYGEDKGREASRDFLTWGTWHQDMVRQESESSKKFLASFKAQLAATQNNIQQDMEEGEQNLVASTTETNDHLKEIISSAQSTSTDIRQTSGQHPDEHRKLREDHPLNDTGKQIISACRMLLNAHEEADRQTRGYKLELPDEVWKQDVKQLSELLTYGRQYGERVVQSIVSPDHHQDELQVNKDALGETGQAAVGMFGKTMEARRKVTVGETMRTQFNALADLARTVPDEA